MDFKIDFHYSCLQTYARHVSHQTPFFIVHMRHTSDELVSTKSYTHSFQINIHFVWHWLTKTTKMEKTNKHYHQNEEKPLPKLVQRDANNAAAIATLFIFVWNQQHRERIDSIFIIRQHNEREKNGTYINFDVPVLQLCSKLNHQQPHEMLGE